MIARNATTALAGAVDDLPGGALVDGDFSPEEHHAHEPDSDVLPLHDAGSDLGGSPAAPEPGRAERSAAASLGFEVVGTAGADLLEARLWPDLADLLSEHGLACYPVDAHKRPVLARYQRVGAAAARALARDPRYSGVTAAGFCAGPRSGLTVVDIDSCDPAEHDRAEGMFGPSPFVVETPSGGRHMYYRHAGERRAIRPWAGLPVDILGGGHVVAPLSTTLGGQYRILRGSLADLATLLPMQHPRAAPGARNTTVHAIACELVRHADTEAEAVALVTAAAPEATSSPLPTPEVRAVARKAWRWWSTRRVGRVEIPAATLRSLAADRDALALLAILSAEQGHAAEFPCTNSLGSELGWPREAIRRGRAALLEHGVIRQLRRAASGVPALYGWGQGTENNHLSPSLVGSRIGSSPSAPAVG